MKYFNQAKVSFSNGEVKSVTNSTFSKRIDEKKEFSFVPRTRSQITPDNDVISIDNRRKYRFI